MKAFSTVIGISAIALLFAVAYAQKPASPKQKQKPKPAAAQVWYTDLKKAFAVAKKQHKVVMVDFNAVWCGPCQLYKKDVFPKAGFQKAAKNLILVEIDVDKQPNLAQKYAIEGIPDIRFFSSSGKPIGKIVGYIGEKKFLADVKKAIAP